LWLGIAIKGLEHMIIETIKVTHWHENGKGNFDMPAGTTGTVLTKGLFERLPWDEKFPIRRAKDHYKKRKSKGLFAYLQGKYRWLNEGSYR